jgi:hypothetical protein
VAAAAAAAGAGAAAALKYGVDVETPTRRAAARYHLVTPVELHGILPRRARYAPESDWNSREREREGRVAGPMPGIFSAAAPERAESERGGGRRRESRRVARRGRLFRRDASRDASGRVSLAEEPSLPLSLSLSLPSPRRHRDSASAEDKLNSSPALVVTSRRKNARNRAAMCPSPSPSLPRPSPSRSPALRGQAPREDRATAVTSHGTRASA